MEEVEAGLHTLLEKIKPALEQVPSKEFLTVLVSVSIEGRNVVRQLMRQVGKWILQFGDKVTKGQCEFEPSDLSAACADMKKSHGKHPSALEEPWPMDLQKLDRPTWKTGFPTRDLQNTSLCLNMGSKRADRSKNSIV